MKKLLSLCVVLCLSINTFSVPSQTLGYELRDGLYFTIDDANNRAVVEKSQKTGFGGTPPYSLTTITVPSTVSYVITAMGTGSETTMYAPVDEIGVDAFYNVTKCTSFTFGSPSNVKTINTRGMAEMSGLTGTLTLPASLKYIYEKGIYSGDNGGKMPIKKLVIPAGIDSLGMSSLVLDKVEEIQFLGTTPPKIYNDGTGVLPWTISATSEHNTPKNIKITIPDGSYDAYNNVAGFDYFDYFSGSSATKHTVTFKNGTTELQSSQVAEGSKPTFSGDTPTKSSTVSETYTFKGWKSSIDSKVYTDLPAVGTSDVTYTAEFETAARKYTIAFVSEDGKTTYQSGDVAYGTQPTYSGNEPTKTQTSAQTYTFKGWKSSVDNKTYTTLPNVSKATTYTAQFTASARKYTITFVSEDGKTTYQSGDLEYGSPLVYSGEEPTKTQTAAQTFTFKGWKSSIDSQTYENDNLPFVENTVTYTAQFDATTRQYTVAISATENGSLTISDGSQNIYSGRAGTSLSIAYGKTLTITVTPDPGFVFDSWTDDGAQSVSVDGNKTIGATFKSNPTDLDEVEKNVLVKKVMRNGILYIEYGGQLYDVRGMKSK